MKKSIYILVSILMLLPAYLLAQSKPEFPFKTKIQEELELIQQDAETPMKILRHKNGDNFGNPGNSMDYWWGSNDWTHLTNTEYDYDDEGFLIEEIAYDAFGGYPAYKISITLDQHKNQTQWTNSSWLDDQWQIVSGSSTDYQYSETDKVLEMTHSYYNSLSAAWEPISRFNNAYNDDDLLAEQIMSSYYSGAWTEDLRDMYEWNNMQEWSAVTSYYHYDGTWYESERTTDIEWYDFAMLHATSAVFQYWSGVDWMDDERLTGTYEGDNYVHLYEMFWDNSWFPYERESFTASPQEHVTIWEFYESDAWKYTERHTGYYDNHQTFQGTKYEYYEMGKSSAPNDGWVIEYYDLTEYTYNGDGLIEEAVSQYWDYVTQELVNFWKRAYSNFGSSDVLEASAFGDVKLFPNPASNSLYIHANPGNSKNLDYKLLDLTGQTVKVGMVDAGQGFLDLTGLHTGLYLLSITDGEMIETLKVQKQ